MKEITWKTCSTFLSWGTYTRDLNIHSPVEDEQDSLPGYPLRPRSPLIPGKPAPPSRPGRPGSPLPPGAPSNQSDE